ncbi:MAG: DNA mismatch repair protein MutS [Nitrospirota bacterium]|nr:MAG: DNA mismatch repair protein MutS [Nitrospirota bacterium]
MSDREATSDIPDRSLPDTPLMKQYSAIKEDYPDSILFFRLGDFYEMFGDDAVISSKVLQITLTSRDKSSENPLPMCGVPHFSAEGYISKLINAGYKVAVCEQVEDAESSKGIVKREVVRVITPGTHEPENPKESSYIISLYPAGDRFGIAVAELSTAEFLVFESSGDIEDELALLEPREVVAPQSFGDNIYLSESLKGYYVTYIDDWFFDKTEAYRSLLDHFKVSTLDGYGCEGMDAAVAAAGALLGYLLSTQKANLGFRGIKAMNRSSFMLLDSSTKKNLELLANLKDGTHEESLLWVLDETLTPMGGRFLRGSIVKPLLDLQEIKKRIETVDMLFNDFETIESIRHYLRSMNDLERLAVKLSTGRVNARDLTGIKNSIYILPRIRKSIEHLESELIVSIRGSLDDFSDLSDILDRAIVDSPPPGIRDGGIIKRGYSSEVDDLKDLSSNSRQYLSDLETEEKRSTGISSLKVGYNKVYGYYIEVTKANAALVPDHYIRKQTLVNSERYITPELKEYETKILGAEEKLKKLELHIFETLVRDISHYADSLKDASYAIALLDFLNSLATAARRHDYVRPEVTDSGKIDIFEGRHPVLERITVEERFIPNDSSIDTESYFLLIITGPNMAGKSTYMRQTALIILMAQMGSFVPAASASIGIVDRIFTRIGASDFLTKGQSTFMVEMVETANIINNATDKSLILLDEVGRGTSTFDGISLAWAIAEHIAKDIKARTLFATHYNELTELPLSLDGVRNLNIAVKEWGDEIIFLRKIEKGPADKSYGIQVARLAGLPDSVLDRAKDVLNNLEKDELSDSGEAKFAGRKGKKRSVQMDLFGIQGHPVISELQKIDLDKISPKEARDILLKLRKIADSQ